MRVRVVGRVDPATVFDDDGGGGEEEEEVRCFKLTCTTVVKYTDGIRSATNRTYHYRL